MKKFKSNNGFSLIELSVVMVIIGLLTAAFFGYLNIYLEQKRIADTNARIAENTQELGRFVNKVIRNSLGERTDRAGNVLAAADPDVHENRLPCPSSLDIAGSGIEQCPPITAAAGTVFNGVRVVETPAGDRIFIGAYPSTTIETSGENMLDGYRSPFIYAVSAVLTDRAAAPITSGNPTGFVHVISRTKDAAGNDVEQTFTDKPFVLVSTGRNGLNARAGDEDFRNMDFDHEFVSYVDRSEANNNNYYDDRVAFSFAETEEESCTPNSVDVQEFGANGTWTKPDDLIYAEVEMRGADGGSSSCYQSVFMGDAFCSTHAGGSGGYVKTIFSDSELPATFPVEIGIGGRGGCAVTGPGCGMGATQPGLDSTGQTTFAGIVLSGGRGATTTANGADGTHTNADFFTTSGLKMNYLDRSEPQIERDWDTYPGNGGSNQTNHHYIRDGKGTDGYVIVTSYICE